MLPSLTGLASTSGADVRKALPIRVASAHAIGRAVLPSPPCLSDLRAPNIDTSIPPALHGSPRCPRRAHLDQIGEVTRRQRADADATEIAVKTLAPQITDLAAHYENALR